jgi:hypothetical protein
MGQEIVTGLNPVIVARIKAHIAVLISEFNYLIQLTKEQRKSANAVAEGRLPMVILGAEHGVTYQQQLGFSIAESQQLARMAADFKALSEIQKLLDVFMEGLSDTTMQIGSNCYDQVLIVRDLAEVAIRRGVPGMETVFDDLSGNFERSPKPKEQTNGNGNNGGANGQPIPGNEKV